MSIHNYNTKTWTGIKLEAQQRIAQGTWKPGELIPHETQLAEEFGCARATVNRALQELADEGLLDRRRKRGTRVAPTRNASTSIEIATLRTKAHQQSQIYTFELLETRPMQASAALQAQHGLAADTALTAIWGVHRAGSTVMAFEECWIDLAAFPTLSTGDLENTALSELLAAHLPRLPCTSSLSATQATSVHQRFLHCNEGTALMVMEQLYQPAEASSTTPAAAVRLIHAPGTTLGS